MFNKEKDFEDALIKVLTEKYGWEKQVLRFKTEDELIRNWANILFENNRDRDRLDDYPLTDSEMHQIIEQINQLRTPPSLNSFINGKVVSIERDNPDDLAHYGKEVSLKIYDRQEIAAGQSRYQIAQQPVFTAKTSILPDRRGDLMLLINGMPVIHVELKKLGRYVSEAYHQIEKYSYEGVFTGLFSLVQIFVAMTPEETVYFANPGREGKFNEKFYFHWADFNNEPINDWDKIASTFLSIPMAHELIGFYTVADDGDGLLKVMRSYQYYATSRISDRVAKNNWNENNQRGGYIWHTTGSGKTLTSFKAAQLVSTSKNADKVVFLIDRIELGTQSLDEYRNFAGAGLTLEQKRNTVQETEDSHVLVTKLKSDDPADNLIVTSIQKMSRLNEEITIKESDMRKILSKRIVVIVDECHRSTFGDMMFAVKRAFPNALFFGFTGTPIHDENQKHHSKTSDIFGAELHRYSIADGIRDKNVLGFDPYQIKTYKDKDLRKVVSLEKAKAIDEIDAYSDEQKKKQYLKYMNDVPMAGYIDEKGEYNSGIEDFIPNSQYKSIEHKNAVVDDILDNWIDLSVNYKYHAIFATSSIPEAIEYYRLFKSKGNKLKITGLFDPSIDNTDGFKLKEDGLAEIITDYNNCFFDGTIKFTIPTYGKMKKDISARLAHKEPYERIERESDKQLDLLIVVDQMLTGYDSRWVNTLYLDKVLKYENIIQSFSRTNRLSDEDKPFGVIKYYRKSNTMERNINAAIKLYSGDKPLGLFVDKLENNVKMINLLTEQISLLFENAGIPDYSKLPDDISERKQFARLFNQLNDYIKAAKIQGFNPKQSDEEIEEDSKTTSKKICYSESVYNKWVQRYKELPKNPGGDTEEDPPYDLKSYIIEIDTGKINAEFMNSRFEKYLVVLNKDDATQEEIEVVKEELHNTFAFLTQEEQKYAYIILHDIESGNLITGDGKTFRDYIDIYMIRAKNDQIHSCALLFGLDEELLREMLSLKLNEVTINEFGRFDNLKLTVDKNKAKQYFESKTTERISMPKVNQRVDRLLRQFIISGGFEID